MAVDEDDDGEAAPPCGLDCDDGDHDVRPGALDVEGDGRDTDCDGVDGVDRDGDGHVAVRAGGDDCDDSLAVVHPGAPDGEGWVLEPFDAGPRTQLALDPWGKPVVAYKAWSPELLCPDDESVEVDGMSTVEVARQLAGSWSSERVELTCTSGEMGLDVANNGSVSVAYTASNPSELHVGRRNESGWQLETIDDSHSDVALVSDACGNPIVGYTWTQWEDDSLDEGRITHYAGVWDVETIQVGSGVDGIELATSPEGYLAASYWLGGTSDPAVVSFAFDQGMGWLVEELDEVGCVNCLWDTSIALSSTGDPEVAVLGEAGMWVLESIDGGWARTDLASGPIHVFGGTAPYEKPLTVSLAIDAEGVSHVAYATADNVAYATDRGGSWATEQVGPSFQFFGSGWPSLALDDLGGVHIAWYAFREEAGSDLPEQTGRYAVLSLPNDGVDENCDGVDGVDADGDGRASEATGGDDPDDTPD